ncbi:hypothetical protein HPB50_021424 [Hyalomma asiaticum]|uniref:Uncharacterized protein n=1 Tax=Hyalomma asiaticum TaxID=266040 RepID=A0ACB7SYR6_HYAAI|nr:hypothetical protein HPB50_021424 [Hyalomma asiaticum]
MSWTKSLTIIPKSLDIGKVEAYRTSKSAGNRNELRSHKFVAESYFQCSTIETRADTTNFQVIFGGKLQNLVKILHQSTGEVQRNTAIPPFQRWARFSGASIHNLELPRRSALVCLAGRSAGLRRPPPDCPGAWKEKIWTGTTLPTTQDGAKFAEETPSKFPKGQQARRDQCQETPQRRRARLGTASGKVDEPFVKLSRQVGYLIYQQKTTNRQGFHGGFLEDGEATSSYMQALKTSAGRSPLHGWKSASRPAFLTIIREVGEARETLDSAQCFQPKWYSLNQRGCNPGHRRTRSLADRPKSSPRNDVGAG